MTGASMSPRAVRRELAMETLIPCCAGLDVHKKTVEAPARRIESNGRWHQATRQSSTLTRDLRAMSDWLAAQGVTHVAMESTGVYWKPLYHILEGRFTVVLVNAQHLKRVPGRKTDVKDCQWIAQLLQHGLLQDSLLPARPQREFRDLTRHRATPPPRSAWPRPRPGKRNIRWWFLSPRESSCTEGTRACAPDGSGSPGLPQGR